MEFEFIPLTVLVVSLTAALETKALLGAALSQHLRVEPEKVVRGPEKYFKRARESTNSRAEFFNKHAGGDRTSPLLFAYASW